VTASAPLRESVQYKAAEKKASERWVGNRWNFY